MERAQNWRLSQNPKLSAAEAAHLLAPWQFSDWERLDLKGRLFQPEVRMGMDPEFFLANAEGLPIPAFHVLAHKSQNPHLFWDGFQAECTVEARVCHQELAQQLALSLQRVRHKILATPVWRIPEPFLLTAEEDHVRLGCDPSHNVYNMHGKHVEDGRKLAWRFAGGHIHFSLRSDEFWRLPARIKSCVRALDAICAVASVCFAQGVDQPIRRKYYGLPGEFRLPEHGLEYRTLSNFWMYHPQAFHLVFDLARWAFNIGKGGLRCYIGDPNLVVDIIQFGDVRSARDLVKLNRPVYEEFLKRYPAPARAKFWEAVEHGFLKVIPDYGKDVNAVWQRVVDAFSQPMWRSIA